MYNHIYQLSNQYYIIKTDYRAIDAISSCLTDQKSRKTEDLLDSVRHWSPQTLKKFGGMPTPYASISQFKINISRLLGSTDNMDSMEEVEWR